MNGMTPGISVKDFTGQPAVLACLEGLKKNFGENGESLLVSDVIDEKGHQYVHLVQKGGGVLGIALIGYTYILEQMNIRFIRLAGTSAGAINTALMTVIGGNKQTVIIDGKATTIAKGDKQQAKSEKILKAICDLNFFDLVDGHPVARWTIKRFITNQDFAARTSIWIKGILGILLALPALDFICLGLQHEMKWISILSKFLFLVTGFYFMLVTILIIYLAYLVNRLKDSGFGINPGDFFYSWIKERLIENDVNTVSDMMSKAETPVPGLRLRGDDNRDIADLNGDVTFIASELVTQNKIEFPKMWELFTDNKDTLQPAGFIRSSMSIPIFFESYFINNIPCTLPAIQKAWALLDETQPPSMVRFVDGGILSNFPINLFYNPNVDKPRLPSFGIDLDDSAYPPGLDIEKNKKENEDADKGAHAEAWSFGGFVYRLFNTVRFYYDKDFLIKNAFYKKGIGRIPLKGFGWLNFFLDDEAKKKMFVIGAQAATAFLNDFKWEDYKIQREEMKKTLTDPKI